METRFPQNKRQLPSSRALYWGHQLSQWRQRGADAIVEATVAFDTPGYVETRAAEAAVGYDLT